MSPIIHKPPIVANTQSGNELLRQKLQRMREWNCPAMDYDPGFGEMPPGAMWIRSDMPEGCERYRFYNEKGEIVTLCFEEAAVTPTEGDDSVILVMSQSNSEGVEDDVVENTATETAFSTLYTIPANTVAVGDLFRVKIYGVTRVDAVTSANFRLRLYFENIEIFDSDDLTLTSPNTNVPWQFDVDFIVDELNEFGQIFYGGFALIGYGSVGSPQYLHRPFNNGSGNGILYSTGADADISVTCDWSNADPDNSCELIMMDVMKGRVGGGL